MIKEKTALITGSTRGIGKAIAIELAGAGFAIALNGRSTGKQAIEELDKLGAKYIFCRGDVSVSGDRVKIIDTVRKEFGRLDILINNAGIAPGKRTDILEATEESFDKVIGANLKGPYFLTQLAARWMIELKKQHPGMNPQIVNISSVSAYASSPKRGDYCISKAGVSMLTKLFAVRLSEEGIAVFEIRPGIIATDMTEPVKAEYDLRISEGITPIRRWGRPEDVAKAVMAIAGSLFPFSTGEVINVDGGFHLKRL